MTNRTDRILKPTVGELFSKLASFPPDTRITTHSHDSLEVRYDAELNSIFLVGVNSSNFGVCRGSFSVGNACKKCPRCKEEVEGIIDDPTPEKITLLFRNSMFSHIKKSSIGIVGYPASVTKVKFQDAVENWLLHSAQEKLAGVQS